MGPGKGIHAIELNKPQIIDHALQVAPFAWSNGCIRQAMQFKKDPPGA